MFLVLGNLDFKYQLLPLGQHDSISSAGKRQLESTSGNNSPILLIMMMVMP